MKKQSPRTSEDRRNFLVRTGAATFAAGAIGLEPLLGASVTEARASAVGTPANTRRNRAYQKRHQMAVDNKNATPPNFQQTTNTDDDIYPDKRGSYSKGLPHNADGTVVPAAYSALIRALTNGEGRPSLFDSIPLGGQRKLTNPQSGFAYEMQGGDPQGFSTPPAPAFNSRAEVAEIVENYWMALLRDVPFHRYSSHPTANAAASDLSAFNDVFTGPTLGGLVTPDLLFRGPVAGSTSGPFLSQFFWLPCFFGANAVEQRMTTTLAGVDYMTDYATWLAVQRGFNQPPDQFDQTPRYMRNGRDLGQWVHIDVLFQAYFHSLLCLFGLGAPVDSGNPYHGNPTQDGFGTFGGPHIATLMCEVSTRALHAVWYQKWMVHRRLRPEAFAGRVEYNRAHPGRFDVHASINDSAVLPRVFAHNATLNGGQGTYLLPMAFPEGSPTHPAYGAGHATVAGACTTILKAWFDEDAKISDLLDANPAYRASIIAARGTGNADGQHPLVATDDGLGLDNYAGGDGSQLTVGGELNKVAYNVANGRNIAGVHWRTDSSASLALGEAVAIQLLREQRQGFNERFGGFSLTKFDGTKVVV